MSSTDRPRFSVVIPAYNEANYIGATLASLARQDFPGAVEVIVVDNNCTDDTAEIARAHGARVVAEPRSGVCHARQTGTEHSLGEIIVSTDADTTFHESWLSRIDLAFSEHPRFVAVAGPCSFADAPWWGRIYPTLLFSAVAVIALLTGRVFYVTDTNISFRRAAWDGYDTRLTQGGDELDLLRRLRRRGKVAFLRDNPTSTSARRLQRGLFYNVFVSLFYYYFLAYLMNRISRRKLMRTAPAFRTERTTVPLLSRIRVGAAVSGLFLVASMLATPLGRELVPALESMFDGLLRLY